MYIEKLQYENIGPIEKLNIIPGFNKDKTPKPLLIVGENGTGKSLLVSNIVDALYEFAAVGFDNVRQNNDISHGYQYFKSISPHQIQIGKEYLYSYISFWDEEIQKHIEYVFKSGNIATKIFNEKTEIHDNSFSWKEDENYKKIIVDKKDVEQIFDRQVMCYFGPDRYVKPDWMGAKYFRLQEREHISIKPRWSGKISTPIDANSSNEENLQWLLDVIADSRADIVWQGDEIQIVNNSVQNLMLLGNARKNIETILSRIIKKEARFGLNYRNTGSARFNIVSSLTGDTIAPTLDSLSTGQMALFNIFATIVRYADEYDINNSIKLEQITGIVVIDEIDLHLHSDLQREVLPQLIRLFPKIQFIITTHSPLFILGMQEVFESCGFDIYEMPQGEIIAAERFSEFHKAYQYLTQTQTYEAEIKRAINTIEETIVITEGATDWKHMKAAYNSLKTSEQYKELFEDVSFKFLEYEPANSKKNCDIKLEMGDSALCSMCEGYSKLTNKRKLIFITDNDVPKIKEKMCSTSHKYKAWGNNVFSFSLPVPKIRSETPDICIEHLYSDSEIKTEIVDQKTGISRRLFMGNEFDDRGISLDLDKYCAKKNLCGEGKINILEGSSKERITGLKENKDVNYGLSKMNFADNVLNRTPPFDRFDFSNFVPIFQIIHDICLNE